MPPRSRRPVTPPENVYAVPRPPRWLFPSLAAAGAVLFAVALLMPVYHPVWAYDTVYGVLIATALLLAWTAMASTSHRVEIVRTTLHLHGGLFTKAVDAADLDIARAEVVDLTREKGYGLGIRLWGAALPDYAVGLFTLPRGGRAWAVVTAPRAVLRLPLKTPSAVLLLSLKDNAGFLARLRAYAAKREAAAPPSSES